MNKTPSKHSLIPLLIITCFAAPFCIGTLLYYIHPPRTFSYGTLLQPTLALSNFPSHNHWTLAILQPQPHHATLQGSLHSRWHALGNQQHRVQLRQLATNHSEKTTPLWPQITLSPKQTQQLMNTTCHRQQTRCHIFIIDPQSRVVLGYPYNTAPRDIDRDLRKLLKLSRIG